MRRYEGSVDKYIGDCVMAMFGVPATHENDAERACRAALDMQLAVRDLASGFGSEVQPPDIHIGINTGLVVAAPMGSGDSMTHSDSGRGLKTLLTVPGTRIFRRVFQTTFPTCLRLWRM